MCVVSFKRFPFYVRSYDAPELRNALEYARRMVRLLFGVELRALHSDVFSTYYDYPVIAQWRTLRRVALDMQSPEMHYMTWLVSRATARASSTVPPKRATTKGENEQIGRASGCPCRSVLVS